MISNEDFYMGMAFMSAARANHKQAAILVRDNEIVACSNIANSLITPDISIIRKINCYFTQGSCELYLTYTPVNISIFPAFNVSKVIYYPTSNNVLEDSDLLKKYTGNLGWIEDYSKKLPRLDK